VAHLGYTAHLGRWFARGAAGAGLVASSGEGMIYWWGAAQTIKAQGTFPTVEAMLTAGRELGGSWRLEVGAVAATLVQRYEVGGIGGDLHELHRDRVDVSVLAGIGYAL